VWMIGLSLAGGAGGLFASSIYLSFYLNTSSTAFCR
jgi:hypothetical protein